MSQQVSLNQLLKKTEHYDKVCGIFDTVVADFWCQYGRSCCARGMKCREGKRDAAGGDGTPDH